LENSGAIYRMTTTLLQSTSFELVIIFLHHFIQPVCIVITRFY